MLALAPQQRLHREQVIDALWPDSDPVAATNTLHVTLHAGRRTLTSFAPGRRLLTMEDDQIILCADHAVWTDVDAFDAAAAVARAGGDVGQYVAALDLYGGDLLPEDRYEEWAERRRETLRRQYLTLLWEMADLQYQSGEYAVAITTFQRVTALEPAHEEAHVNLMRVYAELGQRHHALRQYTLLCRALRDELDAEPEPATQQLHRAILEGRIAGIPKIETSAPLPRRHNLPAALTSFVGRRHELAELQRLLSIHRLVTLTGIGGTGKTRLALETARLLVDTYRDGVWLIELAALRDGALVGQALATVLGIREEPHRSIQDTLVDTLRGKQFLIVLDNCEHLLDACAHLAVRLLQQCPQLTMLATSRERLRVAGEAVWRIPALALPDTQALLALDDVAAMDAVQLFVDRARCYQSTFSLTPQNSQSVIEICRQLDGLPLAIELAAARVRVLSMTQLMARLGTTLRLLADNTRASDVRHQTLYATLEWSVALLRDDEQTCFYRLSVFAGRWSLEAAEAVCSDAATSADQILDLLMRLIDKSLVHVDTTSDGSVRYRLLETVRAYGREQLETSGETAQMRRRHAHYFLAFAEMAEPALHGEAQAAWLHHIEIDLDNIRAALHWALEQNEIALALQLASALHTFWQTHGYLTEGQHWLSRALAEKSAVMPQFRAKALWSLGRLQMFQGDYAYATNALQESRSLYQQAGDAVGAAYVCSSLGSVAIFQGKYDQAVSMLEASVAVFRTTADQHGCAVALVNLAAALGRQGNHHQAALVLEESLACFKATGEQRGIMVTLNNLGGTALYQHQLNRARVFFEEGLELAQRLGDQINAAWLISNLGLVELEQGAYEQAMLRLSMCLPVLYKLGDKEATAQCLERMASVIGHMGKVEQAVRLFGSVAALRQEIGAVMSAEEQSWYERHLPPLRAQLCSDDFTVAWQRGAMMSLARAVEYALLATPQERYAGLEWCV
jgi:predicted ATPase/DNA-binding SARP family transcriptional activator